MTIATGPASRMIPVFRGLMKLVGASFTIIGVVAVLFAALNFAAWRYLIITPAPIADVFAYARWAPSEFAVKIYKQIFDASTDEEALERLQASPNFMFHPTLPFATQRVKNKHFEIGIEGIRYEPDWTDDKVKGFLVGPPGPIFALGGSTMLGHGVSANETIPYFLNALLKDSGRGRVLNLGSQAYDQQAEVAKLIYLLKLGYRPSHVVFLDGWNDVFISRSNMRSEDKITYHGFSLNRGEIAFTPRATLNFSSRFDALLNSLPIFQVIRSYDTPPFTIENIAQRRNAFIQGFDFAEAEFVFRNWAENGDRHREQFKAEIIDIYRANLTLLTALSRAYNFNLIVCYQPIGLFDPANPFITPAVQSALGFRYMSELATAVRNEIRAGQLSMIDLSQALESVSGHRYIDVVHYSPASNRRIAEELFRLLTP